MLSKSLEILCRRQFPELHPGRASNAMVKYYEVVKVQDDVRFSLVRAS